MSDPLEELLRIEGGRVLATLIRFTGDMDVAEDAVQDALVAALERWRVQGVPDNPAAWLTTTARNKALDRIRREAVRTDKERRAAAPPAEPGDAVGDDRLRLLFTCCHPALAPDARVALSLKTIAGLSVAEIARVFLVTETAMARRLTRTKHKIAAAAIPYRIPEAHELPDRLPAVLTAVSTIFTAGHHAGSGRFDGRVDLAVEGVRLARLLVELMPDEPECQGLLALVLATHARRDARSRDGRMLLMAEQDRTRWDHEAIDEAHRLVDRALRRRRVGPFQLQAAVACLHGLSPSHDETDWRQIAELYRLLEQRVPTPVVRVNRAVAVLEAEGADAARALLDEVDPEEVVHWHLWWATLAEVERRRGNLAAARDALDRAVACAMNDDDRRLLAERRTALGDRGDAVPTGPS